MRPARKLALVGVAQRLSDRLPERWGRRARDLGKVVINYRGQRSAARRYVQYELARRTSPVLATPFGTGRLLVDAGDDEIGRTVYVSGGYERWHMEAAVDTLRAASLDPTGKVFVDVGANIGTSTVDALLRFGFGQAKCFEPARDNARLLRMNVILNDLDERVALWPVALSDHDGVGGLRRSTGNSGDHRFSAADDGSTDTVECRRLDAFVDAGDIDVGTIGLVWVDAQGHEPYVLAGAKRILDARVPMVIEFCPWLLGEAWASLAALIADHYQRVVNLNLVADGNPDADVPAGGLDALAGRFARRGYADLLLLP